jgi:hypothetical protein
MKNLFAIALVALAPAAHAADVSFSCIEHESFFEAPKPDAAVFTLELTLASKKASFKKVGGGFDCESSTLEDKTSTGSFSGETRRDWTFGCEVNGEFHFVQLDKAPMSRGAHIAMMDKQGAGKIRFIACYKK